MSGIRGPVRRHRRRVDRRQLGRARAGARARPCTRADPAHGAERAAAHRGRRPPRRARRRRGARSTGCTSTPTPRGRGRPADLVIESGPERLDLKRALFAELDEAAAPDVVLASSSSGFGPSSFQDACRHPGAGARRAPVQPAAPGAAGRGRRRHGRPSEDAVAATMAVDDGARPAPGPGARRAARPRRQPAPGRAVARGLRPGRARRDLGRRPRPGGRRRARACAGRCSGPIATQHLSGGPGGLRARARAPRAADGRLVGRPRRARR